MNRLTGWNGTEEVTIDSAHADAYGQLFREVSIVPQGYPNVDYMLARNRFYVAHRGGSMNYPEHSMLAYTKSVVGGAQALEVSLARTSDGVWFGNHDQSLLRTTGVDVDPSTITWAEVKKLKIKGNLNGQNWPDQEHIRFEELAEIYGGTHVLFCDPKYEQARNRTEFFALLKQHVPDATNSCVIKYFHTATSLGVKAHDEGFKSWGYYYRPDIDANPDIVTNTHFAWDILGLEYDAEQSYYDLMLSYGKPLMCHIAPNAAAANMAFTRGADGLMCSGPQDIIPEIDTTARIGA